MRPSGGQVISNMSRPPPVSCLLHRKRSSREPTRMSSGMARLSCGLEPDDRTARLFARIEMPKGRPEKVTRQGPAESAFRALTFGSRQTIAASPRNDNGFLRRARSGSLTWTAAAQSLIVHLVPVQCWLVAPELRDHFGDQNVRWMFESRSGAFVV